MTDARRLPAALVLIGAVLIGIAWFLATRHGASFMPSYLADWLFWSALPFGALPVVMLIDLAGPGAGFALEPALRRLLVLTPVAAVLLVPILLRPADLFGWSMGHGFSTPFGKAWMAHGPFIARAIIYVVLWALLALIFFTPPAPSAIDRRRGIAAIGLFLYAVTITLAAADWAMAVEPAWFSAEYGILFAASQIAIAVSFAVLLAGAVWRTAAPEAAASFLLGATGIWLFTQFVQFLVIWSGDKPTEITWYLHRTGAGSLVAVWIALIAGVVVPVLLLMSWRLRRHPRVLPVAAVLIIVAQALGMLWLVTPSLRYHFVVSGMDVLEMAGIGGLMLGICLLFGPLPKPALQEVPRHAWR
ncbi:MAG TPA: hypothetical protein PLD10_09535 [Rhodopila sp.]|nr:hypothetical protein [Rhodopila sp.]